MNKQKQANSKESILKTIQQLVPEWKNVQAGEVKLERMAGITNQTYKVSHPQIQPALIFRQFGDASDNLFLNREVQEFVYKHLSQERVGPKVMGMKQDIRIQAFIPSRVLKTKDMLKKPFLQDIPHALRKFHSLKPEGKVPKQTLFHFTFFKQDSPILKKCLSKMKKDIFTQHEQQILKQLKKWVTQQEIQYMKKTAKFLEKGQYVFSHNDLLAGNVLIREKDEKIVFIDYEYSCYNYRVYDIANYFNECIYDYETKQPPFYKVLKLTPEQEQAKQRFIINYAIAGDYKYPQYKKYLTENPSPKLTEAQLKIYHELRDNMKIGEMLSHLMWGWWAIIVSKNPAINFDYIQFAKNRHDLYQAIKTQLQHK